MTERTPESDTVSLSRSEYEALLERLEDAEDMLTLERAKQSQPSHTLPLACGQRILDGEHPLRIWREHRGLTGQALAELSGVPQSYISAIERGVKSGSVRTLSRLAKALNVTLENIICD